MNKTIINVNIEKSIINRYKILDDTECAYLIDLDSNKLTWLFPFCIWFFKQNAYVIEDKEKIKLLRKNERITSGKVISPVLGGGIGSFIAVALRKVMDYFSIGATFPILLIIIMSVSLIFLIIAMNNNRIHRKNLMNIIKIEDYRKVNLKIKITDRKIALKYTLNMLFVLFLMALLELMFISIFLISGNILLLVGHAVLFGICVLSRTSVILPEVYNCKITDGI